MGAVNARAQYGNNSFQGQRQADSIQISKHTPEYYFEKASKLGKTSGLLSIAGAGLIIAPLLMNAPAYGATDYRPYMYIGGSVFEIGAIICQMSAWNNIHKAAWHMSMDRKMVFRFSGNCGGLVYRF